MTKYFPFIFFVLSLSSISLVSADEVVLKNGSRLVGEVLKKEDNTLEFKTPFAGTLKIKWENIVEVKMDKAVKLLLEDDSTQMANKLNNEDDIIIVSKDSDSRVQTIKQSEMVYINPDPWRLGEGHKITGNLNIALKSQRGNTDKDEFDLDGAITFRGKKDRLVFRGEYEQDKNNGIKTDLDWTFWGKYDYFFRKKTFLGGATLFEKDEFADLKLRQTYGVHIGHQYFESKAINLSVQAGFAQVFEDFYDAKDDDFFTGTWEINYDQYFFDEFVQPYHRQLGRLNLEDTSKYIFKSWTGLRFPLAYGFSVSGELQADYDSQPADNSDKTDTTFRFKLGYDF
ncbi:MAG: hypothetical protein DRQ43_04250 [Gammaproteobacteria bacterium]|nr:MAG: hypothetical protein DRQ43_04250 [Gammaproteobacteria bacterium]